MILIMIKNVTVTNINKEFNLLTLNIELYNNKLYEANLILFKNINEWHLGWEVHTSTKEDDDKSEVIYIYEHEETILNFENVKKSKKIIESLN